MEIEDPSIEEGKSADVVIIDTESEWEVTVEDTISKSKNTPFLGWKLNARAVQTICDGKTTWRCFQSLDCFLKCECASKSNFRGVFLDLVNCADNNSFQVFH